MFLRALISFVISLPFFAHAAIWKSKSAIECELAASEQSVKMSDLQVGDVITANGSMKSRSGSSLPGWYIVTSKNEHTKSFSVRPVAAKKLKASSESPIPVLPSSASPIPFFGIESDFSSQQVNLIGRAVIQEKLEVAPEQPARRSPWRNFETGTVVQTRRDAFVLLYDMNERGAKVVRATLDDGQIILQPTPTASSEGLVEPTVIGKVDVYVKGHRSSPKTNGDASRFYAGDVFSYEGETYLV